MLSAGRMPVLGSSSVGLLLAFLVVLQFAQPVAAFGAGNIASISRLEGKNWRHGDIEDTLKLIAFIKGHKWTSMMVKRVYFGNWLRDYSQAVDVGTLKGVQAETIRILLWILGFLNFGYATAEFEVTAERLGCYRPEEHIDNPKDYADNQDARKYDQRLRGPVQEVELQIDPQTGMKNYIANEKIGIATSAGYVKHSLTRCIHYGRTYRHGSGGAKGREEDLCEALRCLGQALHTCEDFGAHSNYCELALRELGYRNVFPHCGQAAEINLHGHRVFPIVTGTFGGVDFLHSVIGEANDHFTQSEVDELDKALGTAQTSGQGSSRSLDGGDTDDSASILMGLLAQVPGAGDLGDQARELQAASQEQERLNDSRGLGDPGEAVRADPQFGAPMGGVPGGAAPSGGDGTANSMPNIDPEAIIKKIYPILAFRDRVVKMLARTIEKIPGLEALVEKITETVTLFVLRLMAPFVRPVIDVVSKQLKAGSSTVVNSSAQHQYEPWTDPHCTDPTHSMLSKDHFVNILNEPAGQVASQILRYVVPRVLWAWEHPDAGLEQIMADICHVFHHPQLRNMNNELHRSMFQTVETWARQSPHNLDQLLSAESVRAGKNNIGTEDPGSHGGSALGALQGMMGSGGGGGTQGAAANLGQSNSAWSFVQKLSGGGSGGGGGGGSGGGGLLGGMNIPGLGGNIPGLGGMKIPGLSREVEFEGEAKQFGAEFPGTETEYDSTRPPPGGPQGQPPFDERAYYGGGYGGGEEEQYQQQFHHPPGMFGYETGPQYAGGYAQGYQAPTPEPYGVPYGGPPAGSYGGPPAGSYGGPPQGYGYQQGPPPPGGYQGQGGYPTGGY